VKPGSFYAYRVDGPFDPAAGSRFNPRKVLIDPYARGHTDTLWNRADACHDGDNVKTARRSVVIEGQLRLGGRPAAAHADERLDHL